MSSGGPRRGHPKEIFYPTADIRDIVIAHVRIEREAQRIFRQRFADRMVAAFAAERSEGLLEMQRQRIMQSGRNPLRLEMLLYGITLFGLNRIQMINVLPPGHLPRRLNRNILERFIVKPGQPPSAIVPFVQMGEFDSQDSGLNLIQPGIVAGFFMVILDFFGASDCARTRTRRRSPPKRLIAPCVAAGSGIAFVGKKLKQDTLPGNSYLSPSNSLPIA